MGCRLIAIPSKAPVTQLATDTSYLSQGAPRRLRMTENDALPLGNAIVSARILVLANQKGGVGKTTTAINLGTALAAIGENVLLIDLDPQGNASTGLGIDRRSRNHSTYDVLTGEAALR